MVAVAPFSPSVYLSCDRVKPGFISFGFCSSCGFFGLLELVAAGDRVLLVQDTECLRSLKAEGTAEFPSELCLVLNKCFIA